MMRKLPPPTHIGVENDMLKVARPRRHRNAPFMTASARRLRREATFPERLLWSRLRAGQLGGIRFRRQHPIGPFVVDFYCAQVKLAIEIDGVSHKGCEQRDRDRTLYLESLGIRVVRFTNDEVLGDLEEVLFRIACEIGLEP